MHYLQIVGHMYAIRCDGKEGRMLVMRKIFCGRLVYWSTWIQNIATGFKEFEWKLFSFFLGLQITTLSLRTNSERRCSCANHSQQSWGRPSCPLTEWHRSGLRTSPTRRPRTWPGLGCPIHGRSRTRSSCPNHSAPETHLWNKLREQIHSMVLELGY